jgi:hypothetical protein
MLGEKYGEFHFAGSSGIILQKLHMKFVLNPIFTILNIEKVN